MTPHGRPEEDPSSPIPLPSSPSVAVLFPAAGAGRRMGGPPKQFRLLGGKPLLVQTLLAFERHPDVHALVVAAPASEVEELREGLRAEGLTKLTDVVAGGATRQESVGAALAAAPATADVVLVHDAVRPFIGEKALTAVIRAVREQGAAAVAVPVADTLRQGADGTFGATVPRQGLYRMQTPQGFRRDWLQAAHEKARRDGYSATDEVDLVQRLGHAVQIVPGSARNFKITKPGDWELAQALWQERVTG
ncbi:MAG: 2-C-methyl-D-erythritol 4-phosphate cytidylyltransferase [Rhodothermales bacterium]